MRRESRRDREGKRLLDIQKITLKPRTKGISSLLSDLELIKFSWRYEME